MATIDKVAAHQRWPLKGFYTALWFWVWFMSGSWLIVGGSSEAAAGHVHSGGEGNGVSGEQEDRAQGPRCKELHVS